MYCKYTAFGVCLFYFGYPYCYLMRSHIYLDESGDLGWKFNSPYRNGGSSRYLTISYLLCPITHCNIPKRFVRDIYSKYSFNTKQEIKASDLKAHHKDYICDKLVALLQAKPEFHIGSITVKKENVSQHIRIDGNKLYNYMMGLSIIHKIEDHLSCKVTRDNISIKVLSGSSCVDYLQTLIWFHNNKKAVLTDCPTHSHEDDGIIFYK